MAFLAEMPEFERGRGSIETIVLGAGAETSGAEAETRGAKAAGRGGKKSEPKSGSFETIVSGASAKT